jgi:hypothetical protein
MTKSTLLAVVGALALMTGTAGAQFADRTIRVSNGINQEHPVGNGIAKMTACLTQKSGGKMKLQAFWGGALGGDLQATQALRSGTQEMVVTSTSPLISASSTCPSSSPTTRRPTPSSTAPSASTSRTRCRRWASSTSPIGRTASATSRTPGSP